MSKKSPTTPATTNPVAASLRGFITTVLQAVRCQPRHHILIKSTASRNITVTVDHIAPLGKRFEGMGRVALKRVVDALTAYGASNPVTELGDKLLSITVDPKKTDEGYVGTMWHPSVTFKFAQPVEEEVGEDGTKGWRRVDKPNSNCIPLPVIKTRAATKPKPETPRVTAIKALRAQIEGLVNQAVTDNLMTKRGAKNMVRDLISRTPFKAAADKVKLKNRYALRYAKRKLVRVQKAEAAKVVVTKADAQRATGKPTKARKVAQGISKPAAFLNGN